MTTLLRAEAVRQSITIHSDLVADMPNILANRVQLQQVFMNLMLNAIEAMKDTGGQLTIWARPDPEAQLVISISDTGVGLPAESSERIFEAFHTTKPQGTGMGLAITLDRGVSRRANLGHRQSGGGCNLPFHYPRR